VGLHERASWKSYCGQQTSFVEDGRYRAYREHAPIGAVSSLTLGPALSGVFLSCSLFVSSKTASLCLWLVRHGASIICRATVSISPLPTFCFAVEDVLKG
jgi:hypothetical protein